MSNHKTRVQKLEKQATPTLPLWAEILDGDRAVLRYEDGRRVEVGADEIPQGVKVYSGWTPDAWGVRAVNYRAGIVPGFDDPEDTDAIPIRLVEYMQRNDDHKDQA